MQKTIFALLFSILLFSGGINAQANTIIFDGDTITTSANGVQVRGNTVYIQAAGLYTLSGTSSDAQIIVDVSGSVDLVFDNLNLTSATTAPLYVKQADRVAIELIPDSVNTLSDAPRRRDDDDDAEAVIYSEAELHIIGEGQLTINGNYEDGIYSERWITLHNGQFIITAKEDGVVGEESITLLNVHLTIKAGDTGLKTDEDDRNSGLIQIIDAILNIESGDYGIEAEGQLLIDSSTLDIDVQDRNDSADGITAEDEIILNDITLDLVASDDGIDTDSYFMLNGGVVTISTGDEAIQVERNITVNDGILIATGRAGLSQLRTENTSTHIVSIRFDNPLEAETLIHIQAENGDDVLTFAPAKTFQNVVFSAPELVLGETYTVYYGGTSTGTATNGLYANGGYSGGETFASFTVEQAITYVGTMRGSRGRGR